MRIGLLLALVLGALTLRLVRRPVKFRTTMDVRLRLLPKAETKNRPPWEIYEH